MGISACYHRTNSPPNDLIADISAMKSQLHNPQILFQEGVKDPYILRTKILHCPNTVGGNPSGISRTLNKLGLVSHVIALKKVSTGTKLIKYFSVKMTLLFRGI